MKGSACSLLFFFLLSPCLQGDRFTLLNGEVVEGEILEWEGSTVSISTGQGKRTIFKHEVEDIDSKKGEIVEELLGNRLFLEKDSQRAGRLINRLIAKKELDGETLMKVLKTKRYYPPQKGGVRQVEFSFSPKGSKTYACLYVPEDYDPSKAYPLFIAIHGTYGRGENPFYEFLPFAKRDSFLLAAPTGTVNVDKGWGYTEEERLLHTVLLHELKGEFNVDTNRVYLAGWSRGGHACWDLALRFPDLFAGINPQIGSVRQNHFSLLPNLFQTAVFSLQGAMDQPQLVESHRAATELLQGFNREVKYVEDPERGHDILSEHFPEMFSWLLSRKRNPYPPRVRLFCHEEEYGRSYWLEIKKTDPDVYKPGAKLEIKGFQEMNEGERLKAYRERVREKTAWIEGEIKARGEINIQTHLVREFTLFLSPEMIDFKVPLTVILNGKRRNPFRPRPDKAILLRQARERRDREMLFLSKLTFSVH